MKNHKHSITVFMLGAISLSLNACGSTDSSNSTETQDSLVESAGEQSVAHAGTRAFAQPILTLTSEEAAAHAAGDALFETAFVASPATNFGGLGPYFNAPSCIACHPNDGKAAGPHSQKLDGFFLRPGTGAMDENGAPLGLENFGTQLFDRALYGYTTIGTPSIQYRDSIVQYADGSSETLTIPNYSIQNPYTTLPSQYVLSPRVAPAVFGGGILEAIDETLILSLADPSDKNQDGISGKVQYSLNKQTGKKEIGRFALKGENPNLEQQIAGAFHGDMGLTTPLTPKESVDGFPLKIDSSKHPEVSAEMLKQVVTYVQTLSVPKRRALPAGGLALFKKMDCASCHTPEMSTGTNTPIASLRNLKVAPFTDMLLHDMGPALADGRPAFEASASEWKTPALWGIGLMYTATGHKNLLHDGRARSFAEAILWHGGEAEKSKETFRTASSAERKLILDFLSAL